MRLLKSIERIVIREGFGFSVSRTMMVLLRSVAIDADWLGMHAWKLVLKCQLPPHLW